MAEKKQLAALIAAAGMSTRMNDFKQTMKLGGNTFLGHIVTRFVQAGVGLIVVVAGHRAGDVREALKDYPVVILENKNYATTQMFDSLLIGLDYLKDRCDRLFLTTADIPLFSVETLEALKASDAKLAVPIVGGEAGHPVLIDSSVIPVIVKHNGERGLRGAFELLDEEPEFVDVDDRGALIDADTQEDYWRLKKLYIESSCGEDKQ